MYFPWDLDLTLLTGLEKEDPHTHERPSFVGCVGIAGQTPDRIHKGIARATVFRSDARVQQQLAKGRFVIRSGVLSMDES